MENQKKKSGRKAVRSVPKGMQSVTPFLVVKNAMGLVRFIERAFDGKVTYMNKMDNDTIMHATVQIGNSTIMLSDSMEGMEGAMESQPAMLYLYVEDIDATYRRAVDANARSIREPRDEFYGDRNAGVKDEWGNTWWVASKVENVSDEEVRRRQEALYGQPS